MYPKGTKASNFRASRPRKRKFHGNQFTRNNEDKDLDESVSAKKLSIESSEDLIVNVLHNYRIIEFLTVFGGIAEILICKTCKKSVKFEESGHRFLGFKIIISCTCGRRDIQSGPTINNGYEINRRIVFVMRLLGIGREGINIFCGLMDLCNGVSKSTYDYILQHIYSAATSMFEILSNKAVEEEKKKNIEQGRPETHLKVFSDRSWKKPGFTSLYGTVTGLIGYYTGKVVDVAIKILYCQACTSWSTKKGTDEYTEWYKEHEKECSANQHEGSSDKMEVDSIIEMFSRSEAKFGVKYVDYIGDDDSTTLYSNILKANPYGDDCPVKKGECMRQNSNESFNSTLRRMAPKHLNSGPKIIQIAAYIAAGIFNEGYTAVLMMMGLLELSIGQQCKMFADQANAQRNTRENEPRSNSSKEARTTARRLEKMNENEFFEEAEGLLYGPSIADQR